MKICLLIPPTGLAKSYGSLRRFSNPQPSIGIAYLAAVLEANQYEVSIVDAYVDQSSLEQILTEVKGADVLGISSMTSSASTTYQICEAVRQAYPNMKIVLGNTHPSIFPEESLLGGKRGDFIVRNEGEETFLELCHHLSGRKTVGLARILGISYMENGNVFHNPTRPFIQDLDSLPLPAWHLYDLSRYHTDPRTQVISGAKEIQILGTRGCPMSCTFCSSRMSRSQGQQYRTRSPSNIIAEMRFLHERYGIVVFNFMDLAFPLLKAHAMQFCRELIASDLHKKIRWVSELRVKPLDEELVALMKESGCARACFGIESGNDNVLKRIKKGFTRSDVVRAIRLCRDVGIETDGMFMLGLPGENAATIDDTIGFSLSLGLRFAIFNLFVPYPGCELYDELKATGEVRYQDWSEFISYPTYSGGTPVYVPQGLTKEVLMLKQSEAMRRFYLNPGFMWKQARNFQLRHSIHYIVGLKALVLELCSRKARSLFGRGKHDTHTR